MGMSGFLCRMTFMAFKFDDTVFVAFCSLVWGQESARTLLVSFFWCTYICTYCDTILRFIVISLALLGVWV